VRSAQILDHEIHEKYEIRIELLPALLFVFFVYFVVKNLGTPMDDTPQPAFRILGLDPGLQLTGYAVIESNGRSPVICEAGVIRGDESKEMPQRLRILHDGVLEIIDQFRPGVVVVEQLYAHYAHPRTAILMGHARGVLLLAAGERGLDVVSYNATAIKKTITGNGRASKEQMQYAIQRELGLEKPPEPPDVADALAVALCQYYLRRQESGVRGQ
jgi:crossover junction endodeoxyribonuclease RuvC